MCKRHYRLRGLLILVLAVFFPARSWAVNFYDGARTQGLYFLTYSSLYSADKTTGPRGNTNKKDYGYRKIEELLRICYYDKNLVLTGFFPVGHLKSEYYHSSSEGAGDVNLGAGYFLPIKPADVLAMLFVKFPTGEYDSQKSVNYGSNQYDVKPTLFFYKSVGRFSVDAAVKYFFRLENHSTQVSPGDELYLQGLLGWQFTKNCKAGPSLNWMKSSSQENDGVKVGSSKREALSAGADVYLRLPAFALTFTYLGDIRAKNTTKGHFFQVKTCYKF